MFPRVVSIEERVRASDKFPRIRDVEKGMKEHEKAVVRKGKLRKIKLERAEEEKRERMNKTDTSMTHLPPPDPIIENPDNYFSSFTLTDDPDLLRFLPYGELNYPKMFHEQGQGDLRQYLDGIWMSGFLDSACKPYATGSGDESGARAAIPSTHSVSSDSKTPLGPLASLISVGESSSSLANSSQLLRGKPTKPLPPIADSAAAPLIASAAIARDRRFSIDSVASSAGSISASVSASAASSSALSSTSNAKSAAAMIDNKKSVKVPAKRQRKIDQMISSMMKPYQEVIKEVEVGVKPKKSKVPIQTFESVNLESYFNQQRIENEAAKKIQYFYRWSNMIYRIRFVCVCMRMTKRIQALIRGFLTRKFVARWFVGQTLAAIRIQSQVRKFLSNLHLIPKLMAQQHAVTQIQRIIRGKIGRVKFIERRRQTAVIKIQKFWRGLISRMHSSRLWLNHLVIPLQSKLRRYIAVNRVQTRRRELNKAAAMIQRQFRSWSACKNMSESLFSREMKYRMDMVTILTAEEEFAEEKLAKIAARLSRHNYKEEATKLANAMYDKFQEIKKLENLYLDQKMQREIVSPRAIVQGWVQALDSAIADLRKAITKAKLECLFETVLNVETIEGEVRHRMLEVDEVVSWRDQVARWKDKEYAERLEISYQRELDHSRKARRQAIGDEKRRWKIRFYTNEGKPDQKRRPDRKWDDSVIAGSDKSVYSAGVGVQLLANVIANERKQKGLKDFGTAESLDCTMAQYSLQTYLDQVNTYQTLLKPIENIMKSTLGGAPDDPNTQHSLGYGDMGAELPSALQDIGAVPDWNQPTIETNPNERNNIIKGRRVYDTVKEMVHDRAKLDSIRAKSRGATEQRQRRFKEVQERIRAQEEEQERQEQLLAAQANAGNSSFADIDGDFTAVAALLKDGSSEFDRSASSSSAVVNATNTNRRKPKKPKPRTSAVIPWALLDELEGEKTRFANERSYFEYNNKFMHKPT